MTDRKIHLPEKIQVQVAAIAAIVVVYFWLQQYVRPGDPEAAIAFVPYGNMAQLAKLAVMVWVLAIAVALLTTKARPEGALAAVLIGAGGFALRSPQMRTLIWLQEDALRTMFGKLLAETVLLTIVIVVAGLIVMLVRRLTAAINPSWVWRDPIAGEAAGASVAQRWAARASERFGKKFTPSQMAMQCVTSVLLQAAIVVVLTMVLLRSSERGQIIFALFIGNLLATLIAHQFFPATFAAQSWLVPMLIGILFYALAAVGAIHEGADAWAYVQLYARALPIDWMTAGAGGGTIGYWISERVHELKHWEKAQEAKADSGKAQKIT